MAVGFRFKGDTRQLMKLAGDFEELASKRFRSQMSRKLAAACLELAYDGFDRSIDPYGKRWKNPKYRSGKPLLDTGRLRASIRPVASVDLVALDVNVIYGATHQFGRGPIPQRQFLPIASMGFGGRWRRALTQVMRDERQDVLGR